MSLLSVAGSWWLLSLHPLSLVWEKKVTYDPTEKLERDGRGVTRPTDVYTSSHVPE